ncbi:hypothetical protein Goshw_006547 [Gossypium schwendimanii]|uniref:Aminotransferase-like plant mobile domain-containing protein n=1 Tax=Gossypium schwendimanii TaxID=34291 RepID=A0A7J9LVM4_GOSSC|nr:hypothetical protein [Gossypium schwendimanii]
MVKGCKLDPTLVSALVERWRPEVHTFNLPCSECAITLEDVQLQLGLPVDGPLVIELVVAVDWKDVGFRQTIPPVPQDIKDLHHIDLRGRMDEHWLIFHAEYINLWNNRCEFLPTREAIIAPELACDLECMPWFRHHGKSNLLAFKVWSSYRSGSIIYTYTRIDIDGRTTCNSPILGLVGTVVLRPQIR